MQISTQPIILKGYKLDNVQLKYGRNKIIKSYNGQINNKESLC